METIGSVLLAVYLTFTGFFGYTPTTPEPTLGLSILRPAQGGTGVGTATPSDVGKVLKVSDDSPFTYTLQDDNTGAGGSFPWTPTSWGNSTSTVLGNTLGFFANGSSTFNILRAQHATSTNLDVTGLLTFNGVTGSTWASFCTTITGSADLCDGNDAAGSGSTDVVLWANASTSPWTTSNLISTGSSTIGNNTGVGGLTISGGATTTQNAYFESNVCIGTNNCSGADLTISSAASFQAPISNATIHVVGANNMPVRAVFDTNNASNAFGTLIQGRRSRGPAATPSAVTGGDVLLQLAGAGYGTSEYVSSNGSKGIIAIKGDATWTDSNSPTRIEFFTVPDSSLTNALRFTIGKLGQWGIGGTASQVTSDADFGDSGEAFVSQGASAAPAWVDVWTEAENTSAGYVVGTRALTVAGTANQITSSAGSQTLAADRTWTLSLPSHVIFPGSYVAGTGTTTNATSTLLNVVTHLRSEGTTRLDQLTSALVLTGSTGLAAEYGGASCTNQVIEDLDAVGSPTCRTITSAYVDSTISTFAYPFTPATSWFSTSTISLNTAGLISTASSSIAFLSSVRATSTDLFSTNATTSFLKIDTGLSFGGVAGDAWSDFCVSITGSSALCDGNDASGTGGAAAVATSSSETATYIPFWTTTSGTPAQLSGGESTFSYSSALNQLTVSYASTTQLSASGNIYTGGNIDFGAGDVTMFYSANNITISGQDQIQFESPIVPASNDVHALGAAVGGNWSDLFLGNGGVINWNNGNTILTHSADTLTLSSGDTLVTTNLSTTNATSSILSISGHLRSEGSTRFDTMTSALLLTGTTGLVAEYTGTTCTNQVVTVLSALGVATCNTISSAYVDSSIATFAYPFTPATSWFSTSTIALNTAGIMSTASSSIAFLDTVRATSTNFTATNATTSALSISTVLSFGGVAGDAWTDFCTTITGGAGLCDGTDATGGGGSTDNVLWANASTSPWSVLSLNANSSSSIAFLSMTLATSTDFISTNATTSVLSASSHIRSSGTVRVDNLTSALIITGSTGLLAEYTGTSCTNQFVRSIDALGVATCATVSSTDVSLANLTATDTTLTFSGTYNGSTARTIGLNLGNANAWTALQTFNTAGIISLASSTITFLDSTRATSTDFFSTNATSSITSVTTHLRSQGTTRLDNMTSALLLTGSTGLVAEYTGTTCTNQVMTVLSVLGVATCTTITSAYVDSSISTFAFPFTPATSWTATSTLMLNTGGWMSTASSSLARLNLDHATTSTAFVLPVGASPFTLSQGRMAFDTTDNQLLIATSTGITSAVIPTTYKLWGATIASTSVDFVSGGRIWLPLQRDGFDITEIHCAVDTGTSVVINISNSGGTTDTETVTCDADGQTDTSIDTNSSYAAGSLNSLEIGTIVGSVDYVTFSVWGVYLRE